MFLRFFFIFLIPTLFSCSWFTSESESSENNAETSESSSKKNDSMLIKDFTATGGVSSITVSWAPFSSEYKVFLVDGSGGTILKTGENISASKSEAEGACQSGSRIAVEEGVKSHTFTGLDAATVQNHDNPPVYTYTLVVEDKQGKELERAQAQATACLSEYEYDLDSEGKVTGAFAWVLVQQPDVTGCSMACLYRNSLLTPDNSGWISSVKGSYGIQKYPVIYNNPDAVKKLLSDSGYLESEGFRKICEQLEEGEEVKWLSVDRVSQHLEVTGRVVKKSVEESGYTYVNEYTAKTAESLKSETKAFLPGTKIITQGFYETGDGGEAVYEISNRAKYTFGSIQTSSGQWCNIVPQNNYMNLLSLGAGRCFQVTWEKYPKWREFQKAKNEAEKNNEKLSAEWESYSKNSDLERINEANKILQEYRKSEEETITLFIPAGNYRMGGSLGIGIKNYVLKGETSPRHLTPDMVEGFEETYAPGDETGSSQSGGTVLYGDNGGSGSLNVWGPSYNTVIEGITWESREIDSKRTYWHSAERDSTGGYARDENGNYLDINYCGRGTTDKSMADEQWFSRQVSVSQCSNVIFRNCEFIITSHVRDMAVYPANREHPSGLYDYGGAFGEYTDSEKNSDRYQANPYVETCDLHTDKQFTTFSFYSGWKNVTVDNCLLYNMSGVFRGASVGFLDFYGEECRNGTVKNCSLFHNCHDEQVGIFTLRETSGNYRESQVIDGVNFVNNKVYVMRDEHVDKIKRRVMAFTVGYDNSRNIFNVNIDSNYIWSKDLPSKLFTFGGFSRDNRKNIVVQNNTIDLTNSGGSYMFETRNYVTVKNNTINLKSDRGAEGTFGGTIFDVTYSADDCEPRFTGNTINVNCNYAGYLVHNGGSRINGIFNGNTVNIKGSATAEKLIIACSEMRNNTFNIQGRINSIYWWKNKTKAHRDVVIDGNTLNMYLNDTDWDYSPGGAYFESGRAGFTFVTAGEAEMEEGKCTVIISHNTINAPYCTTRNKHLVRLASRNANVLISDNTVQKFFWLRGADENSNVAFINNFDEKGRLLKKEDWYFNHGLADTPE